MATPRLARLALLCTALALSACGSGAATPPADPFGAVDARVATAPSGVVAVLVTVTGAGISGDLRTELTRDAGGHWSGRVVNVPPGLGRVVTAYAYDRAQVPADPVATTTGLVYRGARTNVSVTAGQLSSVPVVLLPWPDGGGGTGLNTPPHLTAVAHAASLAGGATTTFSATALDPDDGTFLTYAWSDDAGGTFSTPGGVVPNQLPGDAAPIDWTPPPALVGIVTISLSVTDGTAAATTSFQLAVGSGVDVGVQFDVLPGIAFTAVQSQLLLTGETSRIDYELAYPAGAGPDVPPILEGTARWTDSCGGAFSDPERPYGVPFFDPVQPFSVVYTTPAVAPAAGVPCELRLTLTDALGAAVWSSVMVWVDPGAAAADFTGAWTGLVSPPGEPGFSTNVRLDLLQSGATVTGTFDSAWAVTGTVSGSTLTFHATLDTPDCTGTIDGTGIADGGAGTMTLDFTGQNVCFGGPSTFAFAGPLTRYAASAKVVFVTKAAVEGSYFGGVAGAADTFCQVQAEEGIRLGLVPPGTYAALLSFTGRDAADLVADVPYFLPDGTVVAGGRAELLGGTLRHAIDSTQYRVPGVDALVWTGSLPSGVLDTFLNQCGDWTSSGPLFRGTVGRSASVNGGWSTFAQADCAQLAPLYCIQVSTEPPSAPPAAVVGTWSGRVYDAAFPGGWHTVTLALTQDGATVSGAYTDEYGAAGTVTGTVVGSVITYQVAVTIPCAGTLTGTATMDGTATVMAINYAGSMACNPSPSGHGALAWSPTPAPMVAFVTSLASAVDGAYFNGDLAAADGFCATRAAAGGLPTGTYLAFMSTAGMGAEIYMMDASYALPDGTPVAASLVDLLDGSLAHAIDMDEFGNGGIATAVWTGTDGAGAATGQDCNGWTSTLASATVGYSDQSTSGWAAGSTFPCDQARPIYCFQAPFDGPTHPHIPNQ